MRNGMQAVPYNHLINYVARICRRERHMSTHLLFAYNVLYYIHIGFPDGIQATLSGGPEAGH